MAIVALTVPVMYCDKTGPDSLIQTAEGSSVRPLMASVTVQVRTRPDLPASSGGPVCITEVFTVSGSYGTGEKSNLVDHTSYCKIPCTSTI